MNLGLGLSLVGKIFLLLSEWVGTLLAVLYINNLDVIHLNLAEDEETEVTHEQLQESFWSWGQLLQATGGSLKGAKYFSLSDFMQMGLGTMKKHRTGAISHHNLN